MYLAVRWGGDRWVVGVIDKGCSSRDVKSDVTEEKLQEDIFGKLSFTLSVWYNKAVGGDAYAFGAE